MAVRDPRVSLAESMPDRVWDGGELTSRMALFDAQSRLGLGTLNRLCTVVLLAHGTFQ